MSRLTDAKVASIQPPASGQAEHKDDLVAGLRLRVGSGGRKAWIVRTRAGPKVLNKTLGAYPTLGLADARDQARAFLIEVAKTGAPRAKKTFGAAAAHWVANVAKARNSSWLNQERRLQKHVLPHWKDRALDSITRGEVRDLIEGVDGKVAPSQVLGLIKVIFKYAMFRDWLEASPAEAIPPPGEDEPRGRFLAMGELARVYRAAGLLGYPNAGFVRVLLLTGQRRTEVASMRWADVDLATRSWVIPGADTKNGRAQLTPLSVQSAAILEAAPGLGPYVFTSDGETFIRGFSKAKERLDKFLGADDEAPIAPWRFHDLRRSLATHAVRLGVNEHVVEALLNHSPKGVTSRHYALHRYEPEKRTALQLWADEVDAAVSTLGDKGAAQG